MVRSTIDRTNESPPSLILTSCVLLLFSSVSATIFTEASKLEDGTYPYNTFMIPCAVEAVKLDHMAKQGWHFVLETWYAQTKDVIVFIKRG